MLFKKNEAINEITADFVVSNQFSNFTQILEDLALKKFSEMQSSKPKTFEEMCTDKAILNIYLSLPALLEFRVKNNEELKKKTV
jgi:hypothetical protein